MKMRPCACPSCGVVRDRMTQVKKGKTRSRKPEPGDLSICLRCGAALRLSRGLRLRLLSPEEMTRLPQCTRALLIRAQRTVQRLNVPTGTP